jgi:nucleotide-binding universal stress UspA family protein
MLPVHTILQPNDFSTLSKSAFDMACSLARDYDARLVVVHVQPPPMMGGEVHALITTPQELADELRAALDTLQPHDRSIKIERVLAQGDAATEILRTAQKISCELIVMGTHGRTGLAHLLMGSVAEKVSRLAPCPVLTLKHPFPVQTEPERRPVNGGGHTNDEVIPSAEGRG